MDSAICVIANAAETPNLERVLAVYNGSDGEATQALYAEIMAFGTPLATIAVNLMRAQKNSTRAKVYRGRYRGQAYDRKQWAIDNLATALAAHAEACEITWGWGTDTTQPYHATVLYVELPSYRGQVSFHTDRRTEGPDYPGVWDGVRFAGAGRICRFVARVISQRGR